MADKKYIDVEALIAKHACTKFDENDYIDVDDIRNFPTADVVEVCRCSKCKYNDVDKSKGESGYFCTRYGAWGNDGDSFFCADGERKEKVNE